VSGVIIVWVWFDCAGFDHDLISFGVVCLGALFVALSSFFALHIGVALRAARSFAMRSVQDEKPAVVATKTDLTSCVISARENFCPFLHDLISFGVVLTSH